MKLKCCSQFNRPGVKGEVIEGTTLTVEGLAPSLIEIIQSSVAGDAIPRVGVEMYDDSETHGVIRNNAPNVLSEIYDYGYDHENLPKVDLGEDLPVSESSEPIETADNSQSEPEER